LGQTEFNARNDVKIPRFETMAERVKVDWGRQLTPNFALFAPLPVNIKWARCLNKNNNKHFVYS